MADESEEVIIITKGETAIFDIFLEKKTGFPRPIDLTSYDKFIVSFVLDSGDVIELSTTPNTNGSKVEKISPYVLGQIKVTVNEVDTRLLKEGFGQDIDIEWDIVATPAPKRKRLHKSLNVEGSIIA